MSRPGAGELSLGLAVAALLGGASLSLARLYSTGGWLLPTWICIAAALGLAALLRRLGVGTTLSLAAMIAGFVVVIGNLLFPDTLALVLPTPATGEAIQQAARAAMDAVVEQAAPAAVSKEFLLITCAGAWAVTVSADGLAFRAGQPLLAMVPALGLFLFPAMIRPSGPGWYTLWFLLGAGVLLLQEGRGRLAGWGQWVASPRTRPGGRWRLPVSPANATARRLAASAGVLALAVPWALPGYGREPLLNYRGDTGPPATIAINPFVSLKPNLAARGDFPMFTVKAERGSYWRLITLDQFDGTVWSPSQTRVTGPFRGSVAGDLEPGAPRRRLDQQVRLARLGGVWLPAATAPVEVQFEDGKRVLANEPGGAFSIQGRWRAGNEYVVRSDEPAPTAAELRREQDYTDFGLERYLALPRRLDPRVGQIAEDIAGDAGTPYDQALTLQDWLREPGRFRYDLNAPQLRQAGGDQLVRFLTDVRAGYCEQFSAAMAAMARTLGIPARVAVGFTPGTLGEDGYEVTANDAHAWPELFFNGVGWIRFEPTPRSDQVSDPSWATAAGRASPTSTTVAPGPAATPTPTPGQSVQRNQVEQEQGGAGSGSSGGGAGGRLVLLAVAAGVALVAVAAVPLLKGARRAGRRRRAAGPGDAVGAAWRNLAGWLDDVGLGRRPAETPARWAGRVGAAHRSAAAPMAALTDAFVAVAYGHAEPSPDAVAQADRDAKATRAAVAAELGWRRRVRAALSLRTLTADLRAWLDARSARARRDRGEGTAGA